MAHVLIKKSIMSEICFATAAEKKCSVQTAFVGKKQKYCCANVKHMHCKKTDCIRGEIVYCLTTLLYRIVSEGGNFLPLLGVKRGARLK